MDVLEELTEFEDQIDRAHIERRIDDWLQRIDSLYSDVRSWLPPDWSARSGGHVILRDELMERFDVPEHALPVLCLDHDGHVKGRLEPRGLWIVGANGRIDLFLPPQHFILIDKADNFQTPQWTMTPVRDRLCVKPFTAERLLASLD